MLGLRFWGTIDGSDMRATSMTMQLLLFCRSKVVVDWRVVSRLIWRYFVVFEIVRSAIDSFGGLMCVFAVYLYNTIFLSQQQ
jgi:hypothetical protein